MGCVQSHPDIQRNRTISNFLESANEDETNKIKIVLLGAGECGKSTILKQMKILHGSGYSNDDRGYYRMLIMDNILESLKILVSMIEQFGYDLSDKAQEAAKTFDNMKILEITDFSNQENLTELIQAFWKDPLVQKTYSKRSAFQIIESTSYYMENIVRILQPSFVPTDQDILRSRAMTNGIIQTDFLIDKNLFQMFDVGGQRGERKKWIHCFENVTAILFIASLSEFDQVLREDDTKNRMIESLNLFEGMINLPWFKNVPVLLFLNKEDLFKEKLQEFLFSQYFPAYDGDNDPSAVLYYIESLYLDCNDVPNKKIFCHITTATDTRNIEFVWKSTKKIIIDASLAEIDLL